MRFFRFLGALSMIATSTASVAQNIAVTPQMLTDSLQNAVAAGTPGLSAAIATRRGIIWQGVAGSADLKAGTPIGESNIFGIGSITKVFVAVTVLQLVEEHRLRLDDTPQSVLGADAVSGIANADTATVAHLLAHSAGVPSWEDNADWIRKGRGAKLNPTHRWGKTEALDYVRGQPAIAAPGATYSYSNSGYTLLGLMIEKVTGNGAVSEIRRRILTPLGLRDTYFEGFEAGHPSRVPHRYHYATQRFRERAGIAPGFISITPELIDTGPTNLSVEWTAGGMISSPRDLVRFALALRDGKLLKPESQAFMEEWKPAVTGLKVGHGLFEMNTVAGPTVGHTGGVLGFSAALWWSEQSDVVVAVMGNVGSTDSGKAPPNAASVGLGDDFVKLSTRFAAQQLKPR